MEIPQGPMQDLIARERRAVTGLLDSLARFGASAGDMEDAREALSHIDDLSLLVVAGEFDSGKSAFIDALIGLGTRDIAPATGWITLLKHGPEVCEREVEEGLVEKTLPASFLRSVEVADTPVTNAILRRGAEASMEFVGRADVVLFVTSAEHVLTQSGREFLRLLRGYAGKVLLIVNKVDLLPDASDVDEVRRSVESACMDLIGTTLPIFFVSSFLGAKANAKAGEAEGWSLRQKSGFAALERRLLASIGGTEGAEMAMQAALGVAEKLGIRYKFAVDEKMRLLDEDLKTYAGAKAQLEAYRASMVREYEPRADRIGEIISWMNVRAARWFDEKVRLGNATGLTRTERVRQEFERQVVLPTESMMQEWIADLSGWLADRNEERWDSLVAYVGMRRRMDYVERLVGSLEEHATFGGRAPEAGAEDADGEEALEAVAETDVARTSAALREAVARTVSEQARGRRGEAPPLASTLDLPMSFGGVLVAAFNMSVFPGRRRSAREEFRVRAEALRRRLDEELRAAFREELDAAVGRMSAAMTFHSRFLRAERGRMAGIRVALERADAEFEEIKSAIDAFAAEAAEPPEDAEPGEPPESPDPAETSEAPQPSRTAV